MNELVFSVFLKSVIVIILHVFTLYYDISGAYHIEFSSIDAECHIYHHERQSVSVHIHKTNFLIEEEVLRDRQYEK